MQELEASRVFDKGIEELLTTDQVAKALNVTVKTVRKWRYEGQLPAVKVGKRLVRYRMRDILEWLRTNGG